MHCTEVYLENGLIIDMWDRNRLFLSEYMASTVQVQLYIQVS